MALSYAQYGGTGSLSTFTVPFQYLSRAHVSVTVNGVDVAFQWLNSSQISVVPAPAAATVVEVRRSTPSLDLLVDFADGSTLTESDLDVAALQNFFLTQEATDRSESSLQVQSDGTFAAAERRLSRLADPVDDQDAVTKGWAESAMSSELAQARAARVAAEDALALSNVVQDTVTSLASATSTKRNEAVSAAGTATGARDSALTARDTAQSAATTATTKATAAATSATTARTHAASSAASKDEAKAFRDQVEDIAADVSGYAASAGASATTAGSKATQAAASASLAQSLSIGSFPRDFILGKDHLTDSITGAPGTVSTTSKTLLDDATGRRIQLSGANAQVYTKGLLRLSPGRIFRVSFPIKQTVNPSGGAAQGYVFLRTLNEDFSSQGAVSALFSLAVADGLVVKTGLFSDVADASLGIVAWPAGAKWGRLGAYANYLGTGSPAAELWGSPVFEDVTFAAEASRSLAADIAAKPSQAYVDGLVSGIGVQVTPVKVAVSGNGALSGLYTIDGQTISAGDAVLYMGRTSPAENGIWVAAAGAWSRRSDSDTWAKIVSKRVLVLSGTTNGGKSYSNTNAVGGTLGTTSITYVQSDASAVYTGGTAISVSGNSISFTGTKATVGLGNVDNIADIQKPLSGPQQAYIDSLVSIITSDMTVNIPADYPTLQAAIDDLHPRIRCAPNARILLVMASGHRPTQGVFVRDGDYSHFVITSEGGVPNSDATAQARKITVSASWVGVPEPADFRVNGTNKNFIQGLHARMPVLGCLVDGLDKVESGYYSIWGGEGFVNPYCGVINTYYTGLEGRSCKLTAHRTRWSGAGVHGIRAAHCCDIAAMFAEANNCVRDPTRFASPSASDGNYAAVISARGSHVYFHSGQAYNSRGIGAYAAKGSFLDAGQALLAFARIAGLMANAGDVVGDQIDLRYAGSTGTLSGFDGNGDPIWSRSGLWSGFDNEMGYAFWIMGNSRAALISARCEGAANNCNISGATRYAGRLGDSNSVGGSIDVTGVKTQAVTSSGAPTGSTTTNDIDFFNPASFNTPSPLGILWNRSA